MSVCSFTLRAPKVTRRNETRFLVTYVRRTADVRMDTSLTCIRPCVRHHIKAPFFSFFYLFAASSFTANYYRHRGIGQPFVKKVSYYFSILSRSPCARASVRRSLQRRYLNMYVRLIETSERNSINFSRRAAAAALEPVAEIKTPCPHRVSSRRRI